MREGYSYGNKEKSAAICSEQRASDGHVGGFPWEAWFSLTDGSSIRQSQDSRDQKCFRLGRLCTGEGKKPKNRHL